ncbi:MAG: hypothetical protein GX495_19085 [Chloroflexi bacterium]|jgi:hypothetical protein|nr:hypothetical protein [Chloroflexota bacterium]
MNRAALLLQRLDEIGRSLSLSGHALALLGLGSSGQETARLDEFSDLDFFAIVEPGYKQAYIDDLSWLHAVQPLAYTFRNTPDGYKVLFADQVFAEFAVFEPAELARIPFSAGRVIWRDPRLDDELLAPTSPHQEPAGDGQAWHLGEALTNLYVGMLRYRRGEKLSALRFVQVYALDHVLALAAKTEAEQPAFVDHFAGERRVEQRFPLLAARLADFQQGYNRTPQSALAILAFLEQHFDVEAVIAQAIREQVEKALSARDPQ